jgi:hypothetical protein
MKRKGSVPSVAAAPGRPATAEEVAAAQAMVAGPLTAPDAGTEEKPEPEAKAPKPGKGAKAPKGVDKTPKPVQS